MPNAAEDIKKFKNGGPGSPAPVSAVRPVNCPVCKLNVGAQRFAYHLQKCMGVGTRNSSKERRKKINQTQSTTNSSTQIELKPPRLESDLEYFRSNPVIVKIKVNDRGNSSVFTRRKKTICVTVLICFS